MIVEIVSWILFAHILMCANNITYHAVLVQTMLLFAPELETMSLIIGYKM